MLIYFDEATKAQVTEKMARTLNKTGVLMIGATESLVDPNKRFVPIPEIRGEFFACFGCESKVVEMKEDIRDTHNQSARCVLRLKYQVQLLLKEQPQRDPS